MAAVKAALTSLASAPGAAVEGLASLALGDPLNWEENDHSPPEAFQRQVSEAEDLDQTEAGGEDRRELKQRSGGAVFHFTIVADDFADPKLTVNGGAELKPRQALPAMRASDFFGKLRRHPSGNGGFVLPGNPAGVNGWPSLTFDLEVLAVTARVAGLKSLVGAATIKRCWERPKDKAVKATTANSGGKGSEDKARSGSGDGGDDGGGGGVGSAPSFPKGASTCRVTLLAPAWTMRGYTEQSPGFVFWATTHTTPAGLPVAGSAAASDAAAADAAVAAATAGGGGALLSPALAAAFPRLAALPGSGAVARVAFGEDLVALAANGTLCVAAHARTHARTHTHMHTHTRARQGRHYIDRWVHLLLTSPCERHRWHRAPLGTAPRGGRCPSSPSAPSSRTGTRCGASRPRTSSPTTRAAFWNGIMASSAR